MGNHFNATRAAISGLLGAAANRELDAAEAKLAAAHDMEQRLNELSHSLFAVASLDFSHVPDVRDDGSVIDAVVACVRMLSEEIEATLHERERINQDLEEQVRERTQQLVQAGRMAAIGQLAAGIAHEINNPLGVILGFAEGIERRLRENDAAFVLPVRSIVRETLRCKHLVGELLTYSRTGNKAREAVNLREVIHNTTGLLQSRAHTQQTELRYDFGAQLPQVMGNRLQLEQVVINLGINALDSLKKGGHVTFRISAREDGVALEVEDNGPGIPEEIRTRIFEPFFTTKPAGMGTGLGLSLTYEIVQQHGGSMEVSSTPGGRTTMAVKLPALPRAA